MYRYVLLIIIALTTSNYAQLNVNLISNHNQYPAIGYNDIWGYTDAQGNEYALLGVQSGLFVISLIDPENPIEATFIPGPFSLWRDIKTHSHYAYVTTEGTSSGTGMQIVDLSQLPDTATLVNTYDSTFTSAHNLFIDNGFAYIVGTTAGGVHLLDLSDPVNPVETSRYGDFLYVHDVYVWNDTAITSAGSSQLYQLVDVSDKSNPQLVSESAVLPGIYAHSGWMTEDKRYFIGCDESDVRDITIWDLQDRTSWDLIVPQWQMVNPDPGSFDPVHNVFVKGNFAHISYYGHGYVVLDISDPHSPQLVGNYVTNPNAAGFAGAWGCYPYLASGNILISDIQTGLWVLDFTLDDPTSVNLVSFSSSIENEAVILHWSASSGTNNLGYKIERTANKSSWNKIGFIDGKGSSNGFNQYSFNDESPLTGKSYYRLIEVNIDGSEKIVAENEVLFNDRFTFQLKQNYPNPFNPTTVMEFSLPIESNIVLKIYNSLGELVTTLINERKESGNHSIEFNAVDLPSGLYIALLETGSSLQTVKMSLIK